MNKRGMTTALAGAAVLAVALGVLPVSAAEPTPSARSTDCPVQNAAVTTEDMEQWMSDRHPPAATLGDHMAMHEESLHEQKHTAMERGHMVADDVSRMSMSGMSGMHAGMSRAGRVMGGAW